MTSRFNHSVVGGTFDHFHKGHESLLDAALSQSEQLTIGVSTEELYKEKFLSKVIEAYEVREESVMSYLKDNNIDKKCQIVAIDDIYGTTLEDKEIDAIFVTEDAARAAELINEKRKEKGFSLLKIITVPFVDADDGAPISSERIRKGEIDRTGFVYKYLFKDTLQLPNTLRSKLRTPIGLVTQDIHTIISELANAPMIISVGDIVTFSLAHASAQADLSIVDFKTRRHELQEQQKSLLTSLADATYMYPNHAGKINNKTVQAVGEYIHSFIQTKKKQSMFIKGEEDLLTLPAILLAPLGSIVIYGQYDEGAVLVGVTEEKKREIVDLVKQFTQE